MKNQTKTTQKLLPFLMLPLLGLSSSAFAEDTEAFFNVTPSASNVLFMMDGSASMGWGIGGEHDNRPPTRMAILKNALRTVFDTAPININVGLMTYGPSLDVKNGCRKGDFCFVDEDKRDFGIHGVSLPITAIDDPAKAALAGNESIDNLPNPGSKSIREFIPDIADTWTANGPSPIVDALYEAALYFRGEKMLWGQDLPSTTIAAHPAAYAGSRINHSRVRDGIKPETAPLYKSPIVSECQSNYIILMTDGIPSYYYTGGNNKGLNTGPAGNFFGDSDVSYLAGAVGAITSSSGDGGSGTGGKGGTNPRGFKSGAGGYELIRYISQNDNNPDVEGINTIDTFVVGFGPTIKSNEKQFLETLTSVDDPDTRELEGYYEAQDALALARSFNEILDVISKRAISYASPGYSVNVKSGLEHEREIYVPMFDRRNAAVWPGNLKKFKINEVSGKRAIQDKNNKNATDELGNITDTAIDIWSTATTADPDGKDVSKGGLANILKPSIDRLILSDLGCNGASCVLTELKTGLTANGGLVDNALLGLPSKATATDRSALISFIRGNKADGTPRYHMGDMMHSEPVVITYDPGDAVNPKKQYIFVATNEGYLHAFDTNSGEEKFAFMPEKLLKNIEPQYSGLSARDHVYGLDGGISFWEDKVKNRKFLYFGMRRGGNAYYSLDVTNIDSPKLQWSKSNLNTDYANLGQTWSIPYLAKVGAKGQTCLSGVTNCKEVLIVSGGYDPKEDRDVVGGSLRLDDATKSITTTMGNDIFIIDALNGKRIWSLQSDASITNRAKLVSSVPGGLRMLDTNYNNLVDRLYFADTSGFVWRLDLSELIGDATKPTKLTKFADLGVDKTADARKFYNEPDVSLMKLNGKPTFVVSIGSGFRPHPLDETLNDNFYMLLDQSPYGDPDTTAILEGTLAKIKISGKVGATTVSQPDGVIGDKNGFKGWKVVLPEDGEKSLSTSLAFDGVVTFTTLIPEGIPIDPCDPPATHGRFYAINILTGEAGMDLNDDGTITDADLSMNVVSGDIPGTPQSVFNPIDIVKKVGVDGKPTGETACAHPVDIRIGKKLSQATGYDACRLESVYWSNPVSDK